VKIFITAPFRGEKNRAEIEHLCSLTRDAGFEDFCFVRDVENFRQVFDDPDELMARTRLKIKECDALLFDASRKSTIRALETGIAYDAGKTIIVIAKKNTSIKSTLKGVADTIIFYQQIEDIVDPLKKFLELTKEKAEVT